MNERRTAIDPDGKYDFGDLRHFEKFALRVFDLLPGAEVERTRDVIQIGHGGDEGIIILVTPEVLELRLPTLEWPHPHSPGPSASRWLDGTGLTVASIQLHVARRTHRFTGRCESILVCGVGSAHAPAP